MITDFYVDHGILGFVTLQNGNWSAKVRYLGKDYFLGKVCFAFGVLDQPWQGESVLLRRLVCRLSKAHMYARVQ